MRKQRQQYRLGLALSGGGFRAAFFHLGVLRRLAELGLMRHVTDISTVSGGSIIAAHYYLHFRRMFEARRGKLEDADYETVVRRVEEDFIAGNRGDLRNRLLFDPIAHCRTLITGNGYGPKMSRLYTRHFYSKVTRTIFDGTTLEDPYARKGIPIPHAITLRPDLPLHGERIENRSSGYPNRRQAERTLADFNEKQEYSIIPRLIINATCLNTGGPFHFTLNEIGGPGTGYVRFDELYMLLQYKFILESLKGNLATPEYLQTVFKGALDLGPTLSTEPFDFPDTLFKVEEGLPPHTEDHVYFYLAANDRIANGDPEDAGWPRPEFAFQPKSPAVATLLEREHWMCTRHLVGANLGDLRQAKVAAWYLLDENGWWPQQDSRRGGHTRQDYRHFFARALRNIDPALEHHIDWTKPEADCLLYLVLDLYYLRSAERIAWTAPAALSKLTLSDAVAASANFPPVFTPFKIFDIFDTDFFEALSLTDGGVHDNQGIELLVDDGCEYVLASDAGGLVRGEADPPESRVPMMDRIIDLLMDGVRQNILRNVRTRSELSEKIEEAEKHDVVLDTGDSPALHRAVIFHMTSNPKEGCDNDLLPFASSEAAQLRTDLDAFSELEVAALRHLGYDLGDRFGRLFAASSPFPLRAEVPDAESPVTLPPHPSPEQRRILRAGARLAGRVSAVFPIAGATIALLTAVIFSLAWPKYTSFDRLRQLYDYSFVKLIEHWDRTTLQAFWKTRLPVTQHLKTVAEFFSNWSIIATAFAAWAIYVLGRELIRVASRTTKQALVALPSERRKALLRWVGVLFLRPWNLISIICLLAFVFTLQVKWLFGVLPLWSIPVSLFFALVHHAFTRLWIWVGKLPPDGPPPAPAIASVGKSPA